MTGLDSARRFDLAPLDRQGVILGLGWAEALVAAAALMFATLALSAGAPLLAVAAPLFAAAVFAKARVGGMHLVEWFRPLLRLGVMRRRRVWATTTPWTGTTGEAPRCLAGLEILDVRLVGGDVAAVVWDRSGPVVTAAVMLRVPGADFALLSHDDQVVLLDGWGATIAAHAKTGSEVVRMSWSEVSFRTSLEDHLGWVRGHEPGECRDDYEALVADWGPHTTRHEVWLTVTVSAARLRKSRWSNAASDDETTRMIDALRRATTATIRGLRAADLPSVTPADSDALAAMMRSAIDPSTALAVAPRCGALSARLGFGDNNRMGPYETKWGWELWETDRCVHRTYWVEQWPRRPASGSWMTDLLAHPEGSRRMTVVFEPVPPAASHQRVERDMARLESKSTARAEAGRRISGQLLRAQTAVADREDELIDGFVECTYSGLVTISAASLVGLENAVTDFEASASQAGLVLRPLDGQQDIGWAAGLPLGVGLATSKLSAWT